MVLFGIEKPLKIVTHHWSNNINKGFDIYKYLDDLLDNKRWKKRIRFTILEIFQKILNLEIQI